MRWTGWIERKERWRQWFAWYPVDVGGRTVWLEWVWRRWVWAISNSKANVYKWYPKHSLETPLEGEPTGDQ